MKTYRCLAASLLFVLIASASPVLAQRPFRGYPMMPAPYPPPLSNQAPVVDIVTPGDGTMFIAPVDISICAVASYFTDSVVSIEFFAGTNSLGLVTNGSVLPFARDSWRMPEADFCLSWTNATPDTYALTALATDAAGNTATSSVVDISVVTNLPPNVVITKPRNGENILGPTNITICATAFQPDGGTVASVEFFEGTNSLGVVTNTPVTYITNRHGVFPIQNRSYCVTWNDAPVGAYTLTAVAANNDGTTSTSPPVEISVVTNLPPRVRIDNPGYGERHFAPATIEICATASDQDGTVTNVEFFSGTNSIGVVTNSTTFTNRGGVFEQFCFAWGGVAAGTYTVTATATASGDATATSATVSITVLPTPAPSIRIITRHEDFGAPADIWICAETRHFPESVTSVQYFSGSTSLGIVTNAPFFCLNWTNVAAGTYVLTATATDAPGTNTVTSAPVDITVRTNVARMHRP